MMGATPWEPGQRGAPAETHLKRGEYAAQGAEAVEERAHQCLHGHSF